MKIKTTGRALVITSDIKTADIKMLMKAEANVLEDAKGNAVYAVAMGDASSFKPTSITFTDTDAEGNAQLTVALPCAAAEAKVYVENNFVPAIVAATEMLPILRDRAVEVQAVITAAMDAVEVDA